MSLPAYYGMEKPFPGFEEEAVVDVAIPRTEVTTLKSGLRVVSQETFTYMSAIGAVVEAGSANEFADLKTRGAALLTEALVSSIFKEITSLS